MANAAGKGVMVSVARKGAMVGVVVNGTVEGRRGWNGGSGKRAIVRAAGRPRVGRVW